MATKQKTYELTAQPRELHGKKAGRLRREHQLPGVVYGHNIDPVSVQVPQKELERVYLHAGSNTLIDLKLGEGDARKVFIHDVQRDPRTHVLTHADFMVVNLLEEITTTVALVFIGQSPAVGRGEGMLLAALDHLQVKALPSDMPPMVEVDVSILDDLEKSIHVSDLKIPDKVHVLTSGDELVAKVTPAQRAEAETAEEAEGAEEALEAISAGAGEAQEAGES